jgi:hypothetical protein
LPDGVIAGGGVEKCAGREHVAASKVATKFAGGMLPPAERIGGGRYTCGEAKGV